MRPRIAHELTLNDDGDVVLVTARVVTHDSEVPAELADEYHRLTGEAESDRRAGEAVEEEGRRLWNRR